MSVAFFDLDRTLIPVNSGLLWARHEQRSGLINRAQMLRASLWTVLYHLNLVDIEQAFTEALGLYVGTYEHELEARTRAWFEESVSHLLRRRAKQVLQWHRERGDRLVLLTNSSSYAAQAACDAWQLEDWIANIFEADEDGKLTGAYEAPLSYGWGKVSRSRAWARQQGLSLSDAFFYTDSYSDFPMLEAVGHPRVVAPDPRLRAAAHRNHWPILFW